MVHAFDVMVWLSTGTDFMVASFLLLRGPRWIDGWKPSSGKLTLGRLGLAVLIAGAVFFAKLVLLVLAGLRVFGLIHVLYLDLVVTLPALGLLLLWAGRGRGGPAALLHISLPVRLLALGLVLLAPVGIYATWVEPFRLQLETAVLPLAPERQGAAPIRVGVLADIQTRHVTDYEREAIARMMALAPDLILLPGDLFQGTAQEFEAELPALHDLVSRLSAPAGVYVVLGNVDQQASIERVIAGTELRLLVNEVVQTTARDRRITIGGLELDETSAAAQETIHRLETARGGDDVRLLLTHRPDAVLSMQPGSRVDLVVAGHTHGGQVQLPWFGPLMTLSNVPRQVAAGGYHELDGARRIYVSRGVGHEQGQAPRVRFLCPPEISLLELGG
ncbi:MAG: metallophosphoesterase [Chloroflexi bacterium]|nr:metallophosphoesterase [Chloroflexota bacterium]